MTTLYLLGAITLVILGLITALKIQNAKAKTAEAKAQAAEATAESATKVVEQQAKTTEALSNVEKGINEEHVEEQKKIAAGDRGHFNRSSF